MILNLNFARDITLENEVLPTVPKLNGRIKNSPIVTACLWGHFSIWPLSELLLGASEYLDYMESSDKIWKTLNPLSGEFSVRKSLGAT